MRVTHIVQTLDPAAGGPPAVVLRLAAAQCGTGWEAGIVAYGTDANAPAEAAPTKGIPGIERVNIVLLGREGRGDRLFPRRADAALRPVVSAADMVHLHGVWDPVLRAGAGAARRTGVPYAVTPHGMLDPWSLAQSRWKKRAALAMGYRGMLDGAAFLHFLNEEERALAAPLGLRPPGEIIPNGVFPKELDAHPTPETADAWHRRRPYILFLSRLHYKKGLDILAGAFAYAAERHPDVQLVVAGPDAGAREDFERRVRAAGLTQRVHVVGPLYGADKYAALRHATVFCLPSRQEGFSMAITEAMGCGVPVVISRECHFAGVEEAGAGAVVPLEPAAAGRVLTRLLDERAVLPLMGERARYLVMQRYTWPAIAQRMTAAYGRQARA